MKSSYTERWLRDQRWLAAVDKGSPIDAQLRRGLLNGKQQQGQGISQDPGVVEAPPPQEAGAEQAGPA
jgi:hypothetical protein